MNGLQAGKGKPMLARAYRGLAVVAGLLGIVLAGLAHAQEHDIWRYQYPGDLLYTEGAHSAAVIRPDFSIGMLVLVPGQQGVAGTVTLRDSQPARCIVLTVIEADGTTHTLEMEGEKILSAAPAGDSHMTCNFLLQTGDIALFQAASTWRIATSYSTTVFPLKGSHLALDTAPDIFAAATGGADLPDTDPPAEALAACDGAAGHPWDQTSGVAGASWGDLDGPRAVKICSEALAFASEHPRLIHQLGRACDKAGEARAFELIRRTAEAMRHSIAFNQLASSTAMASMPRPTWPGPATPS